MAPRIPVTTPTSNNSNSWPTILIKAIKELGLPTVLSVALVYIMYVIGIKLVLAHENYLIQTTDLFRVNEAQVKELISLNKSQVLSVKAVANSNIEIKNLMQQQISIAQENKNVNEKSSKILDKI
jgi:hypothetical protein